MKKQVTPKDAVDRLEEIQISLTAWIAYESMTGNHRVSKRLHSIATDVKEVIEILKLERGKNHV